MTLRQHTRRWGWAGLVLGAGFLALALSQADARQAWWTLREVDLRWALLAWAAGVAFMGVKALRWRVLLQPLHPFGLAPVHRAVYVGTAANLVVPHSGELIRASLLGVHAQRPASPLLATVALERILDLAALAVLAAAGALLEPAGARWLVAGGALGLALTAVGVGAVALALRPASPLRALARRALALLPVAAGSWLALQLRRGVDGLQVTGRPGRLLGLLGWSVLQWACIVAAIAACAQAVDAPLPLAGAVLVFVLTVLGLLLPSPPVQLGATQLAFVFAFEWHGATGAQALAASAVYTAAVLGWMLLAGALLGAGAVWGRDRRQPAPADREPHRAGGGR